MKGDWLKRKHEYEPKTVSSDGSLCLRLSPLRICNFMYDLRTPKNENRGESLIKWVMLNVETAPG